MPTITAESESALAQTHFRIRIRDAGTLEQRLTNILWTSFSGIKEESAVVKYPDPQQQRMRKTTGLRDMGDATISTPYQHLFHRPILIGWQSYTCQDVTLEIQPVLCGTTGVGRTETPYGDPFIIDGCKWSSLMVAEANRESNSISMLQCSFSMYQWQVDAVAAALAVPTNAGVITV